MGWFGQKKSGKYSTGKNLEQPLASEHKESAFHSDGGLYIAPDPIVTAAEAPDQPPAMIEHPDMEDGEMIVVSSPNQHENAYSHRDTDHAHSTFSKVDDTTTQDQQPYAISKQNHLNSLFNGHLMKWKFEAEEGSVFIRVPAFFGALGLIATAITAVVMYPAAWEPHSIVMTVMVVILSLFILVLEGRFLSTNPLSPRAHIRNIMTRNFNILRFVWGRGLLYIVAGTLNAAQTWWITIASGGIMILIGIIAIIVGVHASRKFAALRNSLADESFLLLVFSNYDSNGDGYLVPYEFAGLLSNLGMELDDRYTLKAFNAIDVDGNRRISFDEFCHWWSSGYIERGRKLHAESEEYNDEGMLT